MVHAGGKEDGANGDDEDDDGGDGDGDGAGEEEKKEDDDDERLDELLDEAEATRGPEEEGLVAGSAGSDGIDVASFVGQ